MIFTTENSPAQINSSLLSLGREIDFKAYDYNSIINSNNSDLKNVSNTLDSIESFSEITIADTVEKALTEWTSDLNVTVGGNDYYISSVASEKGKLVATAEHIEMARININDIGSPSGNNNISKSLHIPAYSKFFINLTIGPVTNSGGLNSINFRLRQNASSGNSYNTYFAGSSYEVIELGLAITKVAIPINGYTKTDLNYAIVNISAGSSTSVPCTITGYYIKPFGTQQYLT